MNRYRILIGMVALGLVFSGCKEQQEVAVDATTQKLLVMGEEALFQKRFDMALVFADSAERRVPELAEVQFLKGRTLAEMLRFAEAEAAYRKALDLKQDYEGVYNNLGNLAFRQGEFRQAIRHYHEEIERHPAAIPWRGIGRALVELGARDSARVAFEESIRLDSSYAPAYLSLALLHEANGETPQALGYVERGFRADPADMEIRYQLGSLLSKSGRHLESLPHFKAVIDASPWYHAAWYQMGQALVRIGKVEEARLFVERAELLRARDAKIVEREKMVRAQPQNVGAHAALGTELRLAGRYNDAVHAYMVAYNLDPQDLEIQNNIAALHLLRQDTLQSIRWYEHVVEQDPTMVDAWLNLGIVNAISGKEAEARRAWKRVLQLKPENAQARRYLAKLEGG